MDAVPVKKPPSCSPSVPVHTEEWDAGARGERVGGGDIAVVVMMATTTDDNDGER